MCRRRDEEYAAFTAAGTGSNMSIGHTAIGHQRIKMRGLIR
ncbi:hypothetical protein SEA_DATBOI_133 [Gordonia phage DatBoi]|nr:hypothetical protein SEA_DATBOI_133 [Gordonia phage DatBoi]